MHVYIYWGGGGGNSKGYPTSYISGSYSVVIYFSCCTILHAHSLGFIIDNIQCTETTAVDSQFGTITPAYTH